MGRVVFQVLQPRVAFQVSEFDVALSVGPLQPLKCPGQLLRTGEKRGRECGRTSWGTSRCELRYNLKYHASTMSAAEDCGAVEMARLVKGNAGVGLSPIFAPGKAV